jgi:hypothetical protein
MKQLTENFQFQMLKGSQSRTVTKSGYVVKKAGKRVLSPTLIVQK